MTPCSLGKFTKVSEEIVNSIFSTDESGRFSGKLLKYVQSSSVAVTTKYLHRKKICIFNSATNFYQQVGQTQDFFLLMPPHVHTKFHGPPSWLWRKCNRLLRLGRLWGAVTLSRWCEGWYIGKWGARRGLMSKSTNYPDHGHHGDPTLTRKIPMVEPGIEPGTLWLVVRRSDH